MPFRRQPNQARPVLQPQPLDVRRSAVAGGRKASVAVLIAVVALTILAPAAMGSTRPVLSVRGSGAVGTTIVVRGARFPARALVQVRWDGAAVRLPLRTSYAGTFSVHLVVPRSAKPGVHIVSATRGRTLLARVAVRVPVPAWPTASKVLFGIGPELDSARAAPITGAAPVHMLTSWFNGSSDLAWMTSWSSNAIPNAYAAGDALHLIVYANGSAMAETPTAYGPAYGRPYPLSAQFLADMTTLAKTWGGAAAGPPLYVTLFTEFQTYAPTPVWSGNVAYWSALKDAYLAAAAIFHANAPNARVSLGWGGWEARMGSPMFANFADVMAASDFQSFQAMQSDTNVTDIEKMTAALGRYGPVMVAHYKPDNGSQTVFDADTTALFTDAEMGKLVGEHLFAFSFMDARNMDASTATLTRITAAIRRYGR